MGMDLKTKTWDEVRKTARRVFPVVAIAVTAAIGLPSGNVSAVEPWGPKRDTFTWKEPAGYVTFNSITDNPRIGDERNFVRVREAGTNNEFIDKVDLKVGKEYEVAVWFHNDAMSKLNKKENNGVGIAENVRLRMEQPERVEAKHSGVIKGIISSTNSKPAEVFDTAYTYSDTEVFLRYVPNSAVIHSLGTIDGKILSSDALFGKDGAKLGYWADLWGTVPGCNEYSGYVTYRFKVDQPSFSVSKTAAIDGTEDYKKEIKVKPGDVIDFKVEYKNTGTTNQLQIKANDAMPKGLKYVNGTSYYRANFNKDGNFISDAMFNGGANLGDYKPGDYMSVTYKVEVTDDKEIFSCGDSEVYNNAAIATQNGTKYDKVKVTVHRDCEETPTEKPKETPKEETPEELPNTGATEIVLSFFVITSIGICGSYYIASRKQLKKLMNDKSSK